MPSIISFLDYLPFPLGETFPEKLKTFRMIEGLSQEEAARRLGVDPTTVRKWEAGLSRPSQGLETRALKIIHIALGEVCQNQNRVKDLKDRQNDSHR